MRLMTHASRELLKATGAVLDDSLRTTLAALIDTILPPSSIISSVPLSKAGVIEAIEEVIASVLTWRERAELVVLLRLLSTGVGTAALAHTWPTAFASLAPAERERVLLQMGASAIPTRRKALHSLKALPLLQASRTRRMTAGRAASPASASSAFPARSTSRSTHLWQARRRLPCRP